MPDLKITRERLEDATNVIIQYLRDAGFTGSLEDGTGLNDIVVKPNALLRVLMGQMVDRATAYQSLQKASELRNEIGEEEYAEAVDSILSNWFVTRHGGKPSTGIIRLWFLQPPDFMQFKNGQRMGSIDGVAIVADSDQIFIPDNFATILNTTENQNEYYVDVSVRTQANSTIAPTDTTDFKIDYVYDDIYYLRATVPGEFLPGTLIESSDDFIRRTEQAITTRELITSRAINTVLLENFSDIIRLYVARHGSGEQLRDIVHFEDVSVHVGNKADIYIASRPIHTQIMVHADENGFIDPAQLPASSTIIAYLSARDENGQELQIDISSLETHWCSRGYRPASLRVNATGQILLDILSDTVVSHVHDFVYSDEQRVACYDPLVKHMFPLLLYPVMQVELVDKKIDSTRAIKDAVLEYIDYTVVNGLSWVASELVASVHVRVPNVRKIKLPIQCEGRLYDPLSCRTHAIDVGNAFNINDNYDIPHSKQITGHTVQFYSDKNMISVVSDYTGS